MKNIFAITISSFLVLVFACAKPGMQVIDDPTMNRTIYQVKGLFADVSKDYVGTYGNLGFRIDMYVSKSTQDTTFYIKLVALTSKDWNFILGDTLVLTIDGGKTITTCSQLANVGDDNSVTMQHVIYHLIGGWYQIDRLLLRKMTYANSVKIGIHTSDGVVPGELAFTELAILKKFFENYVE